MPLAEFRYIEKALSTLDKERDQLEVISKLLQMEFTEIMNLHTMEYLNITTRVKGRDSLKEKILRKDTIKNTMTPSA